MKRNSGRPVAVVQYVRELEIELASNPDRRELVAAIVEHIDEALAQGEHEDSVLRNLGDPHSVAEAAVEVSGADPSKLKYWTPARILLAIALGCVLGIALLPIRLPISYPYPLLGDPVYSDPTLAQGLGMVSVGMLLLAGVLPLFGWGRTWMTFAVTGAVLTSLNLGWNLILIGPAALAIFGPSSALQIAAVSLIVRSARVGLSGCASEEAPSASNR